MATTTLTAAADAVNTAQVRVSLRAQEPEFELPEATGSILVSTEFRRYQLSTLVNRLLSTEKPIPFEFVVNGQFIRSSLDDFLTENGISSETTLQVEYVPAQIPPQHVTSFQHDDWVSSVDVLSATSPAGTSTDAASEVILSSSYDGLLRIWNAAGDCMATSTDAHGAGIKSARFISPTQIASSSLDHTVRIWTYKPTSPTSGSLTPTLELLNHTSSVDRLAGSPSTGKILAASSDNTISIFSAKKSSSPEAPSHLIPQHSAKRRKLSTQSSLAQRGALGTLRSHTAPVSDIQFAPDDATVAYSTSWDHSLKTWDLTSGVCVDTRPTSHALLSVCAMPETGLVAAGTAARHISLIDPRAGASSVVAMTLRGHANAVVTLAGRPGNGYVMGSGSHDGTVRVWDVRMGRSGVGEGEGRTGEALYVLHREGEKKAVGGEGQKVFGMVWDEKWGIVSGGEDKRVQVHQDR